MISDQAKKEIDFWVTKYPEGRQSSAVMQALTIVQNENNGSLTGDLMQEVADHLQMPAISVQEVATFYENYNHKPVGKHIIRFCHNISCMLNGSDDLISYLEEKLQVKTGEISKDGLVSVKKVECLGACVGGPMCQIGDQYYEHLTPSKLDNILDDLK
jgi:NADH-quinone oxidoreductase subunit E